MSNIQYTPTSVRKLVDKFFSLQWCRDNLVVPLYEETSLPMSQGVIKIAIANYSYLGTIASPIKERADAITQKKRGKYTYGPTPGPDPCGKVVWLCNGEEYNSESDYKSTSCGQPKKNSQPEGVADNERCARFVVGPRCPNNPYGTPADLPADAPECFCK